MRTLGLLGGMSWESTALYYRHLNELARERLGGLHSAQLLLWSFDFAEIAARQHRRRLGRRRGACSSMPRASWRRAARRPWSCAPTPCTSSRTRCRPPCRYRCSTSPTPPRRRSARRVPPAGPAGDRLHHGAGFLQGQARDRHGLRSHRAGCRRARHWCTRHLRRALPRRRLPKRRRRPTARDRRAAAEPAPTASSWAAPRSPC